MKTHVLFVCTANQQRSPTAESLYESDPRFSVKSAGTSPYAIRPLSNKLIRWADWIVVMEDEHRSDIESRFPALLRDRSIHVLGIPDIYQYGDLGLMREIRERFEAIWVAENAGDMECRQPRH